MKSRLSLGLGILSLFILVGCASGPALEKYSRTALERPYTLPEGVATWQIPALGGYLKDDFGSATLIPIPAPVVWQSSLTDNWTLNWGPLPLSVSHQIDYSSASVLGTTFGFSGLGYSSDNGLMLLPTANLYWRKIFSKEWGLEVIPAFTSLISTQGADTFVWEASVGVGPMYQATEHLAFRFAVQPSISSNYYLASLGSVSTRPTGGARFTLPLSVGTVWSFHRQWDFRANYSFNAIGQLNNYQAHLVHLNFVHFW